MSVDDWVQERVDVFLRLTLLLELVQRPAADADSEVHDESAAPGTANFTMNSAAGRAAAPAAADSSEAAAAAAIDASLGSVAMQELREALDSWLRLSSLSLILAPTAFVAAFSRQGRPSQSCPASKQFWAQVTARMQYSETQLRMLIAGQKESNRLNQLAIACIPDMPNQGACTALFEAVLMRQQQQQQQDDPPLNQQQQQQPAGGTATPPAAAAAATAAARARRGASTVPSAAAATAATFEHTPSTADDSSKQPGSSSDAAGSSSDSSTGESVTRALNRHMSLLLIALQCLGYFFTNTSSQLQLVIGMVASYPHHSLPSVISSCALEIYHQRKALREQQEQQEEQQQQQQEKKQQQGGGTGKSDAQSGGGGGGAAAAAGTAAATPLQQLIAAEVQQHLQQRSDMMLQQMHAWGLD
jgi:hypothetical protein